MALPSNHVAEMQGLYGPFTLTERVVQKIWLRGDFDRTRLVLTDGRPLEIRTLGAWNLLGGPDFRGAQLVIGGESVTGDVEVHFHAADWRAHRHQTDRAYDHVALHVVLFPPGSGERSAVRGDGRAMPTLVLLPLLHRDLEEYASDDALEAITARDEWEKFAGLAAAPAAELPGLLRAKAGERWRQKVRFSKMRIERVGWTAAAHCTALEILGYRHNRAAMLTVATKYPLEAWRDGVEVARIYEESGALWQTQGVRPANHPLVRLRQYQAWVAAHPDWPERLRRMAETLPAGGLEARPTAFARRTLELRLRREAFARDLIGGAVGGTRLDNLVCDGLLPLLAAESGRDAAALWFHWFLGDVPGQVRKALPKLGVAGRGAAPLCQGWAQGLLGWVLAHDARASR
ncbi:MAG: DUF2851 family protein [Opitutae bacterium]|nr:DUF2851 family protein [Opitutae bacterium]